LFCLSCVGGVWFVLLFFFFEDKNKRCVVSLETISKG
jgi:hypothetical protein